MHTLVDQRRAHIALVCGQYGVRRLEVFGSAARGTDFDPATRDVDFLVAFEPDSRLPPRCGSSSVLPRRWRGYWGAQSILWSGAPCGTHTSWPVLSARMRLFMPRDVRAYLWDEPGAAAAIPDFVAGLDAATDAASDGVHAAVERTFGIMGEALNQRAKLDPALARRIPDSGDIIAFRNLLIHGCATVDHDRVWRIVSQSLPELRTAVDALLAELGPPEA